jgi:membrane protease YdiL (CAAX protease family)
MVELSPTVVFILAASSLASFVTLFWLFQKHIDGRPLLPCEPRRAVPWNFLAPLVVLAPLIGVAWPHSAAVAVDSSAEHAATMTAATMTATAGAPFAGAMSCAFDAAAVKYMRTGGMTSNVLLNIWAQVFTLLALTIACYVLMVLAYGATRADLGLPSGWRQAGRDAAIGAVAFLAAIVPIYGIQILLTSLFKPEHGHPLIEELTTNHSPQMMTSAAIVAVLAAPLYEETAFRLTFQGWLERVDAKLDRWRRPMTVQANVEADLPPVELAVDDSQAASALAPEMPPGWAPVLISGVLFGAAHLGHGVAPVSLVLLGLILGYVYQRTHRIVPSIVCHMLFNGFSIAMLWLQLRGMGG